MGKFKRNYQEVDRTRKAGEGYSGEVPKPGIYDAELVAADDHTSAGGNEGSEWIFRLTTEPYEGWQGWVYANDNTAAWKEVQILEAVGVLVPGKEMIETTYEKIVAKAGPCRVRVRNETYEDEKRGKITTILPPKDGETSSGEAPTGGSKKKKKKSGSDESPF